MRKSELLGLVIIIFSFIIGIFFYPQMSEKMASHWNAQGQVDSYMPKFWGLFLMPFTLIGLLLLFIVIPKIDPLKANIEEFRKHYDRFVVVIIIFLFYLYLLTILWNLDVRFNMIRFLIPVLGMLIYYTGVVVENVKMNWFIGIRTPWTLSSEEVWMKTHKIGGKLFKVAGVLAFLGAFFEGYMIFFILIPVFSVAAYTIAYSYFEYKKEVKNSKSTQADDNIDSP